MPPSGKIKLECCESGAVVWVDASRVIFLPARDPKSTVRNFFRFWSQVMTSD